MGLNGNNRCAQPGCPFGAAPYLTRDLCEEHFDIRYIHPIMKERSRLDGELTKLHREKMQAKLDYGVRPEPIWLHCQNMGKGCSFKTLKMDVLKIHQDINCKHKKAAPSKPRQPGQPKPAKAAPSPQEMTDE